MSAVDLYRCVNGVKGVSASQVIEQSYSPNICSHEQLLITMLERICFLAVLDKRLLYCFLVNIPFFRPCNRRSLGHEFEKREITFSANIAPTLLN